MAYKYNSIGLSGFESGARYMVHRPGRFYSGKCFHGQAIAIAFATEKACEVTEFINTWAPEKAIESQA